MSQSGNPRFAVVAPDHLEALEAVAPMLARLQRAAGPDAPLVLAGPLADAIRSGLPVVPGARVFVLAGERRAAERARAAARTEIILGSAPVVISCTRYPEGPRQMSMQADRAAYRSPLLVDVVGYDRFNRRRIEVPDVHLVADLPAITMSLARVDDGLYRIDQLAAHEDVVAIERLERVVRAAYDHAVAMLDALTDREIEREARATPEPDLALVGDLLRCYIVERDHDFADVCSDQAQRHAHAAVAQIESRLHELDSPKVGAGYWLRRALGIPSCDDETRRRRADDGAATAQVTQHPGTADGKGLAPVVSLDDLRTARAARSGREEGFSR